MYEKLFGLSNTFYFMLIELLVQEQCLFFSISEKHPDHFSTHCINSVFDQRSVANQRPSGSSSRNYCRANGKKRTIAVDSEEEGADREEQAESSRVSRRKGK
jgi:hypothetical protein